MGKIIDVGALSRFKTKFIEKVLDTEGRGIHFGTETDYPLSAAHTAYPMGVTLIYTASSTSYPYGTGTVVTIRSTTARCVQYNVGNTPNNYKLRTADSSGWSDWKSLKDVPGVTDLQKAIGIVVDGNKAASTAAIGQFVVLKNSTISGCADGLYIAAEAIPASPSTIDGTYLTAVTGGGLNALLGQIPEQLIHMGTETDYPLSAAHTAYQMGITLIYTPSSTSYPYGTGTVVTIRSASARCVQFSFGNSPNSYKLRTADSNGWSEWKTYSGT